MSRRLWILAGIIAALTGCTGSRWARSDADYARKYSHHSDDFLQMVKQSLDARFIEGRDGYYTSVASGTEPATASAEIGMLVMPTSWLETRVGATGIVGSPGESLYGGGNLGVRFHSPSRLAPFFGIGGYAGMEPWKTLDENSVLSISDERDDNDVVLAFYPELGAHFWLTTQWRLTTSTSYYVGWGEEPWFFSIGLARIPGPTTPPPIETWIDDWVDEGKTVNDSQELFERSPESDKIVLRLPPVE